MIPMSADQTLEVPDPSGSGHFKFRYILDKHQPEFIRLYRELGKRQSAFLSEASDQARAEMKGKKISAGELQRITGSIASQKFIESLQETPDEFLKFIDSWINLFVCGWSSNVEFPDRPSACFGIADKLTLFSLILSKMTSLSGLGVDEVKK
jgi:hypothetical protein